MLYFDFYNYMDMSEWCERNGYRADFIEGIGRSEIYEFINIKDNSSQLVCINFEIY